MASSVTINVYYEYNLLQGRAGLHAGNSVSQRSSRCQPPSSAIQKLALCVLRPSSPLVPDFDLTTPHSFIMRSFLTLSLILPSVLAAPFKFPTHHQHVGLSLTIKAYRSFYSLVLLLVTLLRHRRRRLSKPSSCPRPPWQTRTSPTHWTL